MTTVDFKGAKLSFDGSFVTYEPNWAMRKMLGKQGFRVPIGTVQYLEYRAPSGLTNGFLRINTGQPPLNEPAEALRDQHSFHFEGKKATPAVAALKAEIEHAIATPTVTAPAQAGDHTSALAQLALLRDQGILTDEEFAAKKAEILSRI